MDMDAIDDFLMELRAERDRIDDAVSSLEQLVYAFGNRRRGRPPKWMAEVKAKEAKTDRVAKTSVAHSNS